MANYDKRKDLAPRDIVARAIDSEMKKSGARHVWLDTRAIGLKTLHERFPNIYDYCAGHGLSLERDMIPVVPAAHYLCGGVKTNLEGETSLSGLYACGEVACTGLHGANRLASNSLLEAVVMANRGAAAVLRYTGSNAKTPIRLPEWVDGDVRDSDERVVLLHNWLLHRSDRNATERPRRAFSLCLMDAAISSRKDPDRRFPKLFGRGAMHPGGAQGLRPQRLSSSALPR